MVNFALVQVLLWIFSWISVSVSQFYTVEVQPGEEVTLQCSNFTNAPSHVFWFKLANGPNASCISSMSSSDSNVLLYDGFQDGKFNMTSNTSVIFLDIKRVNFSDSGLYFCGEKHNGKSIIISGTYLKVQEEELTNLQEKRLINLTSAILGGLTVFLLMVIISLVVKIRTFHTAHDEGQNPQHIENVHSDAMNYAALNFRPKPKSTRSAPQRELETNVVYAAKR